MQFEDKIIINGMIRVMFLQNEYSTSRHTHDFLEFVYIVSGTARHHLGNSEGVLQAGDYFVVDYNTSHDYVSPDSNLTIINCLFLPEFIDKTFTGVRNFNELAERYFFRICERKINGPASNQVFRDGGSVGKIFMQMLTEYSQKQDGYLEILRFLLCEIIIQTVRQVGSDKHISINTEYVINEIENNFQKRLMLSDICNRIHYSLPYVSTKFKEDTGITFTQYLQNRRIEESCRLLCEGGLGVTEISQKVGYDSVKFFNRVFKQVTKMTPREYRRHSRKK